MTSQPLPGGLEGLAARCEAATGADRELDVAICWTLAGAKWTWEDVARQVEPYETQGDYDPAPYTTCSADGWHPKLTASLDAALALVGEKLPAALISFGIQPKVTGCFITWPDAEGRWFRKDGDASTPALALCAALLRALSSHEAGER